MFSLEKRAIFLSLAGSQAHGTARDGSDVDLRGVCIAQLEVRVSLFSNFEQLEGPPPAELAAIVASRLQAHPTARHGLSVKSECVIFDIAKFVGLCANANPNALEILFADERDWLIETPTWRQLHCERYKFLTKKVQQTFLGYAMAQLKKIKTHRAWLLNPPKAKPMREEFGLPGIGATLSRDDQNRIEQSIAEKIRSFRIDDIEMPSSTRIAIQERLTAFCGEVLATSNEELDERTRAVATRALSLPVDVVQTLNAEKRYRAAMAQWDSYQLWKSQRNPARAKLERDHGYDTKHAMHLIRLMRMGLEVLEHGDLLVRRPDAEELKAIRDGYMTFDELSTAATRLQARMEKAAADSNLLSDVDRNQVDELAIRLMLDATE